MYLLGNVLEATFSFSVWFLYLITYHPCGLLNTQVIHFTNELWYDFNKFWEDKGIYTFPKRISMKLNAIAQWPSQLEL